MRLVDVHCHLESDHYKGIISDIVREAADAGLVKMITSSIVPSQWPESLKLMHAYNEVECALGVHPWYIKKEFRSHLPELMKARELGASAIGEIGLDTKIDTPSSELQTMFFEDQLKIAVESDLPVIIHCRGAFQKLKDSIKRVGLPKSGGIIHSFNGSAEIAQEFIKIGLDFSIGGILTYRDSRKRVKLLKKIYPDHFLLETDSPDITPIEARTDPPSFNRPSNIVFNLNAAAELLDADALDIAEATTANAVRIFGFKI